MNTVTVTEMWEEYTSLTGKDRHTPYQSLHFCNNKTDANELAELTRSGIKKATASLYQCYALENEPLPEVGDLIVITNWDKEAACIIEIEKIEILPFKDINEEHARIEGEGDQSLDFWRSGHMEFFTQDAKSLGIEFNETMDVVFQTFKVVYQ
jgi:uncharacterized protein YhfF